MSVSSSGWHLGWEGSPEVTPSCGASLQWMWFLSAEALSSCKLACRFTAVAFLNLCTLGTSVAPEKLSQVKSLQVPEPLRVLHF